METDSYVYFSSGFFFFLKKCPGLFRFYKFRIRMKFDFAVSFSKRWPKAKKCDRITAMGVGFVTYFPALQLFFSIVK